MSIWHKGVGALLTEDSYALKTEDYLTIIADGHNVTSWTLTTEITTPTWTAVTAITTPTWSLANGWFWENRDIKWEDADTYWQDAG